MFRICPLESPRIGICLLALALLAGCGGERLLPVKGRVTLAGQPVTKGHIWFVPDPAKGNTHTNFAPAALGPDGSFELFSFDKPGLPLGWYKVVVYATKNDPPASPYGWVPQWLVPVKYTTAETTDLSIEVVAEPAANAYQFDLQPDH